MRRSLPWWLVLIAVFQPVPLLIFPLETLKTVTFWIWAIPLVIFVLLGWGLLRGRLWARTATTFVQGFSVIVRLLSTLPAAAITASGSEESPVMNLPLVVTALASIALSTLVLVNVDRPEVSAIMQ